MLHTRSFVPVALALTALGCGPQVPPFPRGSAASEETPAAPLPSVGTALRAEPPFDDGADAAAPAPHDHHHHGGTSHENP